MSIANNFPNSRPSLLLDFANTKTLDPRVTFTRASTATFYDGRTVAKAEENLLIRSQEFGDAIYGLTGLTQTANSTTAPDGTTTAALVAETTSNSAHLITYLNTAGGFSTVSGSQYIFSFFAKKGPGATAPDWLRFRFVDNFTAVYANFNITTLATGLTNNCTASVTDVGNGWVRCVAIATASATAANNRVEVQFTNNTNSATIPTYVGSTTSNVFMWGWQVEQRSSVTAYTPTTTQPITNYIPVLQTAAAGVPRFDHNPTTGESLGLLIEEQRTNLLTYSEQFDNAAWEKTNTGDGVAPVITTNQMVAPDGTLTADHVVFEVGTSAAANRSMLRHFRTTSGSNTLSFWVKSADPAGANQVLSFTFGGGVVAGTITVTNQWQRVSYTGTGSTAYYGLELNGGQTTSKKAAVFIWGAQLEAGSFPTSYIKTEASQVTRSGDAASMTGANFSSWYRADEGTLYAEFMSNATSVGGLFALNDGTGLQTIDYRAATGYAVVAAMSVLQANILIGTGNSGMATKIAVAYAKNDYAGTKNAGAIASDSSVILPVGVNTLRIGSIDTGTNLLSGAIKKLAYYPKRLTNANLQALTS